MANDVPTLVYHFPCPRCGAGMPSELPLDHPKFHPLQPVVLSFDCATCGAHYSTLRNEDGSCRDVTQPRPASIDVTTPEGSA